MSLLKGEVKECERESEARVWYPPPDTLGRSYLLSLPNYSLDTWQELCIDPRDPTTFPEYKTGEYGVPEAQRNPLNPQIQVQAGSSGFHDSGNLPQSSLEAHLVATQPQPSSYIQMPLNYIQPQITSHSGIIQLESFRNTEVSSVQHPRLLRLGLPHTLLDLPHNEQPQELGVTESHLGAHDLPASDLNTHLRVGLLDLVYDKPNNRTPHHLLRWFGTIYTMLLEVLFYMQSLFVAPCAICCWAVCFGCLTFMNVWVLTPVMSVLENVCRMLEMVMEVVCWGCVSPVAKNCGLILSRIHITHVRIRPTIARHFFHRDWD
ncbi:uncharacterized protein [Cherax quadricarinatus]|uniref:uncharacterized protein n=1 Tax=Cherax quadricarinatus TaxID=27406 RepID=UPI002377DA6A|nr:uncharacterized protein LOC128699566 [Cherax quadricarinatus]